MSVHVRYETPEDVSNKIYELVQACNGGRISGVIAHFVKERDASALHVAVCGVTFDFDDSNGCCRRSTRPQFVETSP